MTSNISSNIRTILNTPPSFNGDIFDLWKARFKVFIKDVNYELWKIIINGLCIPNHYGNGEVVDKYDFIWIK